MKFPSSAKTLGFVNLQDQIRKQIEADIAAGVMQPGALIEEKRYAEAFNTSRTPIREALIVLSERGLVDIVPRTGIYVRKLQASELVAMMEALGELEGVLARLAARRIGSLQRAELLLALETTSNQEQAGDIYGYQVANASLHELIYQASGNPFIVEQARSVRLRIAAYRSRMFEKPGRLIASQREHEKIVHAILAGDANEAAEAMRDHISAGGRVFADLILENFSN